MRKEKEKKLEKKRSKKEIQGSCCHDTYKNRRAIYCQY